jgi:hypothetical protein
MVGGSVALRLGGSVSFLMGCLISAAAGQAPAGHEAGVQGLATFAAPSFAGGGVSYGWRLGGRTRVVALAAGGSRDASFTGRGELVLQYLLAPDRRRGLGFYGLGGIAGVTGRVSSGYLVAGVGMESAPGGGSGWLLECGVGGGFRLTIGWRRRWLHRSAPPP